MIPLILHYFWKKYFAALKFQKFLISEYYKKKLHYSTGLNIHKTPEHTGFIENFRAVWSLKFSV